MECAARKLLLEMARLRLRTGFHAKFPSVAKQAVSSAVVNGPAMTHESKLEHLEAARQRLRGRLASKFATVPEVEPSFGTKRSVIQESPLLDGTAPLKAARLRISERFQRKFQPNFTGFPDTIDEAKKSLFSEAWGATHAAVVTTSNAPYKIVMVNPAWEELCGFSQRAAYGKTFKSLGIIGSFTEPGIQAALNNKLERAERGSFQLTNAGHDGRMFSNYLRVAPLRDEASNQVTHFIGVLQDTGTRKMLEASV